MPLACPSSQGLPSVWDLTQTLASLHPIWGWDVQCEPSPAAFPLHGGAALVDVYGLGLIWLSTGINGFGGKGLPGGPGKTTLRIPLAMRGTSV